MSLAAYQAAFVRASFAASPTDLDLGVVGDRERFLLYRRMIRGRLLGMARVAFKESAEQVGGAALEASFARYLDREPPASPLLRDVIANFGGFARRDGQLLDAAGPHLLDLLSFEEAKWRVGYAHALWPHEGAGLRELDFEGALALNPTLRLLALGHAVHKLPDAPVSSQDTRLLVYRPPGDDSVRWYAVNAFFFALLERAQGSGEALATCVRAVVESRALMLDQTLLESLSSDLTTALQRGVILGVRDPD